jgi:hypothetical protein
MMVLDIGVLIIEDKRKSRELGLKNNNNNKKAGEKHVQSYLGQQHCSNISALTSIGLRTVLKKIGISGNWKNPHIKG